MLSSPRGWLSYQPERAWIARAEGHSHVERNQRTNRNKKTRTKSRGCGINLPTLFSTDCMARPSTYSNVSSAHRLCKHQEPKTRTEELRPARAECTCSFRTTQVESVSRTMTVKADGCFDLAGKVSTLSFFVVLVDITSCAAGGGNKNTFFFPHQNTKIPLTALWVPQFRRYVPVSAFFNPGRFLARLSSTLGKCARRSYITFKRRMVRPAMEIGFFGTAFTPNCPTTHLIFYVRHYARRVEEW